MKSRLNEATLSALLDHHLEDLRRLHLQLNNLLDALPAETPVHEAVKGAGSDLQSAEERLGKWLDSSKVLFPSQSGWASRHGSGQG